MIGSGLIGSLGAAKSLVKLTDLKRKQKKKKMGPLFRALAVGLGGALSKKKAPTNPTRKDPPAGVTAPQPGSPNYRRRTSAPPARRLRPSTISKPKPKGSSNPVAGAIAAGALAGVKRKRRKLKAGKFGRLGARGLSAGIRGIFRT